MDLDERKRRLKEYLEFESDKEMLSTLKTWHFDVDKIYQDTKVVDAETAERLVRKYFWYLLIDKKRVKRLGYVMNLLMTFELAAVDFDNITMSEASTHAQDILNNLVC